MKYGITAATHPDSPWGRTMRWRCDRYGRPLAFDSEAKAREAAKAFNDQRCSFEPSYDNIVQPLEKEEVSQWGMQGTLWFYGWGCKPTGGKENGKSF